MIKTKANNYDDEFSVLFSRNANTAYFQPRAISVIVYITWIISTHAPDL